MKQVNPFHSLTLAQRLYIEFWRGYFQVDVMGTKNTPCKHAFADYEPLIVSWA